MKIIKEKTTFGTDIILEEDTKILRFSYGGNLDLYWSIHSKNTIINNNISNCFIISKENYAIYELFEKLFDDIKNINLFDEDDFIPLYIETEQEKKAYFDEQREYIKEQKNRYRKFNYSKYNELYDQNNKTITWYSDETSSKVANFLIIKQEENTFKLEFYTQPYLEGYDEDFHSGYYIPIRFRNSGSKYAPFNIIFMKMYNNLSKVDDANDVGHQIHIEEYLYEKRKTLIKKNF